MSKTKEKTLDGQRIPVSELNLEAPFAENAPSKSLLGKLATAYKNLSLVMAGMYTGLNCYGTPHAQRETDSNKPKPDNRLI